jgi:hypothetical protein
MVEQQHRAIWWAALEHIDVAFAGLAIPSVSVSLASQSYGVDHFTLYCAIVIAVLVTMPIIAILLGQDSLAPGGEQPG